VTPLLIDTGPLVAMLSARDHRHSICVDEMSRVRDRVATTWPVLAETTYLLRGDATALEKLFKLIELGTLTILSIDAQQSSPWFSEFFGRYRDQKPELADASLVYVAEQLMVDTVFTLDRRHFHIFRLAGGRSFNLIPAAL
jgi:uncharacterized protein